MDTMGDHAQRIAQVEAHIENIRLKRKLESAEISNTLIRMGRERAERELYHLRAWTYGFMRRWFKLVSLAISYCFVDRIMTSKRLKRRAIERMVKNRVAEAIAKYERNQTNPENDGGSGSANTGGVVALDVHGCSYKTFLNCKPHSFNGTEGVVGLSHWFEKME
ncbi:hypothetical protein Tco_0072409 [Tanacetum coccineum]